MYISPLMLLVLEPDAPGDAAFAVGLAACNRDVSRGSIYSCSLRLTDRIGGTSTCCIPFLACMEALILAAAAAIEGEWMCTRANFSLSYSPAAAAGSGAAFFFSSVPGLRTRSLTMGLLLCRVSEVLLVGERERLSKREERLTSGSVWSKRERFAVLRSSSAMTKSAVSVSGMTSANSELCLSWGGVGGLKFWPRKL